MKIAKKIVDVKNSYYILNREIKDVKYIIIFINFISYINFYQRSFSLHKIILDL